MNLYLVQHGEPVDKEIDPERPLTERGRQAVARMAQFAAKHCKVEAARILHSGKLRARQTAEILAAGLQLPVPDEADGLAPMNDPDLWVSRLGAATASLMLVGHLPHLARLTGLLLCGGPDAAPVRFRMGGIVALHRAEGRWTLQWLLVPDMAHE